MRAGQPGVLRRLRLHHRRGRDRWRRRAGCRGGTAAAGRDSGGALRRERVASWARLNASRAWRGTARRAAAAERDGCGALRRNDVARSALLCPHRAVGRACRTASGGAVSHRAAGPGPRVAASERNARALAGLRASAADSGSGHQARRVTSADHPPVVRRAVTRDVHLQFCVPVAAVLKAQSLELVVARRQLSRVDLEVAPGVARCVLRAVDADERAEAVVGVHTEGVHARGVHVERDADVERDVVRRAGQAHVLVPKEARARQGAVAVALRLGRRLGTRCKLRQSGVVRAAAVGVGVVRALGGEEVDTTEDHRLVVGVARFSGRVSGGAAGGAAELAALARLDRRHELRVLVAVEADGAEVDGVGARLVDATGAGSLCSGCPENPRLLHG